MLGLDIIRVGPVRFAFKVELVIVIDDHGEAVTIEVIVSEANEAVVFEVQTHRRIAKVFFNCAVILQERGGGICCLGPTMKPREFGNQ